MKQNLPIYAIIDSTVEAYGRFLHELEKKQVEFMVCSTPPAGYQPDIFHYPYFAPFEKQAEIYKVFNERLKVFCEANGFRFLDIYSKTVGANGHILPQYNLDDVHLNRDARDLLIDLIGDPILLQVKGTNNKPKDAVSASFTLNPK